MFGKVLNILNIRIQYRNLSCIFIYSQIVKNKELYNFLVKTNFFFIIKTGEGGGGRVEILIK